MNKIPLISLILWSAFFVFGCTDSESQQEAVRAETSASSGEIDLIERTSQLERESIPGPLASVVDHFRKEGLAVDDVHRKAYEMIGAVGGLGLTLEGAGIEIYLFNPATADEAIVKSLENARGTGIFLDPKIEREIPVVVVGNIMLLGLEFGRYSHPEKDRIIEVFERL